MNIGKTLYVTKRGEWRKWLEANFQTAEDIWLVYPLKHSGKACILYNDAVEEALCFGWIDSLRKKLDDDHSVQRFTPRKKKSNWSQPNIERLRWLLENEMVHESLAAEYRQIADAPFVFPEDILAEIRQHPQAWQHYQTFSESYKRIRIAYIDSARPRPEIFEKRLANFIQKTEAGKKIVGFGGVEKYY